MNHKPVCAGHTTMNHWDQGKQDWDNSDRASVTYFRSIIFQSQRQLAQICIAYDYLKLYQEHPRRNTNTKFILQTKIANSPKKSRLSSCMDWSFCHSFMSTWMFSRLYPCSSPSLKGENMIIITYCLSNSYPWFNHCRKQRKWMF